MTWCSYGAVQVWPVATVWHKLIAHQPKPTGPLDTTSIISAGVSSLVFLEPRFEFALVMLPESLVAPAIASVQMTRL